MKNNKKGFTLIELLSVIILISLLLGIGVPGISRISSNMKKKALNTKINLIEQAGILYGQDNKAMLQTDSNCKTEDGDITCKKIAIKKLIEDDYLDSENHNDVIYKNPVNDVDFTDLSCDDVSGYKCCVNIYKKNNRVYAYFGEKSCEEGLKDN